MKITKGPFETKNTKATELTVLCRKKSDIKDDKFKKVSKEGLCVRNLENLSEEKKQRIMELRQKRIQGAVPQKQSVEER